jgi:hypothetical protein
VLDGFRGSYDNNDEWDADYEMPTTVYLLINQDSLDRPVIFVWNNNADTRDAAHGDPGRQSYWEGFAAPRDKENYRDEVRRQVIYDWNLGREMNTDIENGVWRVIADCEGAGVNDLSVRAGHFVRAAEPHKTVKVPTGWRYV